MDLSHRSQERVSHEMMNKYNLNTFSSEWKGGGGTYQNLYFQFQFLLGSVCAGGGSAGLDGLGPTPGNFSFFKKIGCATLYFFQR